MSKKILHILKSNTYSGAENVACQIINMFKEDKEFEMAYVSPDGPIKETLKEKNIKYIPLKKFGYSELKKVIKEYKPDIIHAHDFSASLAIATINFKGKKISHIHQNPNFIRTWGIKSILYNLAISKFYRIIVVSDSIKDEAVFLKNKKNVEVITNCVNKNEIIKKISEFPINEAYDIAFIGRLSYAKNYLRVIDIIKKINEISPEKKAVIIGDGEERTKCEEYIKEKQLENVIELKGFLSNPYPYLKNSKILLMPSIIEGFGLVAIESMICGVPVLNSGVRRTCNYI